MSLLIALFLIICYMCIKGFEKSNNTQYNMMLKKRKQESDIFCKNFLIPYYEVEELLSSTYRSNKPLCEVANRIKLETGIKYLTVDMVVLGYYAKDLHIPWEYFYGIERCPDRGDIEDIHRFVVWYNKELLNNGFEYKLVFSWQSPNHATELIPLDGNIGGKRGCYIWEGLYSSCGTNLYRHGLW